MGSEEQLPQGPPLSVGLSFLSHVCLDSKLSVCPTQRFSDRGSVPPGAIWQCLETFLVLTPEERCCWHLRGRGRGCCFLLCDTQAAPLSAAPWPRKQARVRLEEHPCGWQPVSHSVVFFSWHLDDRCFFSPATLTHIPELKPRGNTCVRLFTQCLGAEHSKDARLFVCLVT